MIALRERPAAFGPSRVGALSLVAITTLSRLVKSLSARPTNSSLPPFEYMLAVSKKLIPASSACLIRSRLAPSSTDQAGWPRDGSPNPMQPMQIGDTSRPLWPSLMYCMRHLDVDNNGELSG